MAEWFESEAFWKEKTAVGMRYAANQGIERMRCRLV